MMIREMSRDECLRALAETRIVRLACAHENQPYIVPVYLAYHLTSSGEACLYGFTTPGQKVAWMRANPRVCVEVDKVAGYDRRVSVIAMGRYEELPQTQERSDAARHRAPERPRNVADAMPAWSADSCHCESDDEVCDDEVCVCDDQRLPAWQVLKTLPVWWQPGSAVWAARAHHDSAEPFNSVYYSMRSPSCTWLASGARFQWGWTRRPKGWAVKIIEVSPGDLAEVVLEAIPRKRPRSRWQPSELFQETYEPPAAMGGHVAALSPVSTA
jgi:uncharacterized protein